MRNLLVIGSLLFAAVFAAGALQAQATVDFEESFEDPPLPTQELITGTPIEPLPGSETPQKDPFTPYDIGDPSSAIPYEALSPEEKAVVDRGRNVAGWRQIHDAYGKALAERSKQASAEAAVHQLGIDELSQGVVP